MVGPGSKYLTYFYETRMVLQSEADGLRIIGERHHEFLQAVPEVVENIFAIGFSNFPGSRLYEARVEFDARNPTADDLIRSIKVGHFFIIIIGCCQYAAVRLTFFSSLFLVVGGVGLGAGKSRHGGRTVVGRGAMHLGRRSGV